MDCGRILRIVVVWNGLRFDPRFATVAMCAEERLAGGCHLLDPLGNVFRATDRNGARFWCGSLRRSRGPRISRRMGHAMSLGVLRVAKTGRGLA